DRQVPTQIRAAHGSDPDDPRGRARGGGAPGSAFGGGEVEALWVGVEVHAAVAVVVRAGEAREGLAELVGGLDGEGARGGDAGQQRNPCHARLLDDLEARA